MNTKKLIGCIVGIAIVAGFWWFYDGKDGEKLVSVSDVNAVIKNILPKNNDITHASSDAKKTLPAADSQVDDKVLTDSGSQTKDETREDDKYQKKDKIKTASDDIQAPKTEPESATAAEVVPSHETEPESDPEVKRESKPEAEPVQEAEPEPEPHTGSEQFQAVATVTEEKQYFWKPFALQKKADGFAKQIALASGVQCMADKTGIGKYQVYFRYKDKMDKNNKISMIETMGIKLNLEKKYNIQKTNNK